MAILTYHHVGACPPEQADHHGLWVDGQLFGQQMRRLHDGGWQCVTLRDVLAGFTGRWKLPRRWFVLTFDDGWRDNYTAALPVLRQLGFRATVFVVTSWIRGGPATGRWDETMSVDELVALKREGWEIGSHTHTHPRLPRLDDDAVRTELRGSRDILADLLGSPPDWFCYPYGAFSRRVARQVREAGYQAATSTIRDNRVRAHQRFWLPRAMVMDTTTPLRLRYMMSGLYHMVHALKNRSRWEGLG